MNAPVTLTFPRSLVQTLVATCVMACMGGTLPAQSAPDAAGNSLTAETAAPPPKRRPLISPAWPFLLKKKPPENPSTDPFSDYGVDEQRRLASQLTGMKREASVPDSSQEVEHGQAVPLATGKYPWPAPVDSSNPAHASFLPGSTDQAKAIPGNTTVPSQSVIDRNSAGVGQSAETLAERLRAAHQRQQARQSIATPGPQQTPLVDAAAGGLPLQRPLVTELTYPMTSESPLSSLSRAQASSSAGAPRAELSVPANRNWQYPLDDSPPTASAQMVPPVEMKGQPGTSEYFDPKRSPQYDHQFRHGSRSESSRRRRQDPPLAEAKDSPGTLGVRQSVTPQTGLGQPLEESDSPFPPAQQMVESKMPGFSSAASEPLPSQNIPDTENPLGLEFESLVPTSPPTSSFARPAVAQDAPATHLRPPHAQPPSAALTISKPSVAVPKPTAKTEEQASNDASSRVIIPPAMRQSRPFVYPLDANTSNLSDPSVVPETEMIVSDASVTYPETSADPLIGKPSPSPAWKGSTAKTQAPADDFSSARSSAYPMPKNSPPVSGNTVSDRPFADVPPRPTKTEIGPRLTLPAKNPPTANVLGELDESTRLLAKVGDQSVLAADLLWQINMMLAPYEGEAPPEAMEQQRQVLMKQMLPQVIEFKLTYMDFRRKMPPERMPDIEQAVFKRFNETKLPVLMKEVGVDSAAALDAKLREAGSSLRKQQVLFMEQALGREMVRQNVNVNQEVTHDELLDYYFDHLSDYQFPAQVKWERLTVRWDRHTTPHEARVKLARMGDQILQGTDFARVAASGSEGPRAAEGGKYDWTTKGALRSAPIDKALFEMEIGRPSSMIEDDEGVHIVRVIERKEAGRTPFETVQNDIKDAIREERFKVQVASYVQRLKNETHVTTVFDNAPQNQQAAASSDLLR